MLVANAVVDTDQPRLQVGENQMDDRQVLLGNLWITTLGNSEVLIAALTEASIAAPIVSNDQRSRRDGALDEPTERLGATVEHDGEPNASGMASVFPVVELGARLSMTHLDGTGDENLVVNTTAFPTRSPANPGFVHLNMVLGLSTDPVLVGPHHARAELVENLKGRLVARKTKLPLKLHGGHAGRLTGDQISGQNQTFSGVWLRSITVPTVSPVFWRHLRQRRTPGRFSKWNGSPAVPQCGQAKPSPQRAFSR